MATKKARVEYVGDAASLIRATQKATATTEKAGKQFENVHLRMRKSFGGLTASATKMAGGVAAAYASVEGVKKSVEATDGLAKATLGLHKNFGLSIATSSRWAGVMKARGVDSKQLSQAFGTLSKNAVAVGSATAKQEKALKGLGTSHADMQKRLAITTKSLGPQAVAFQKLGLSAKDVQGANKDFQGFLGKVADGMKALPAGSDKAALAMKLFGKGWQTVVPMLRGGSKAMDDQLALADKYGITLKGKTVKSIEEFTQAQRESKMASLGLQVAIGTTLMPAITKGVQTVSAFVANMRNGSGVFAKFRAAVKLTFTSVKAAVLSAIPTAIDTFGRLKAVVLGTVATVRGVARGFIEGKTGAVALVAALSGLAAGFAVYKAVGAAQAAIAAFRATTIASTFATGGFTGALTAMKVALLANPVGLAIAGIAALGVALFVAYKKSETFRNIVNGAFAAVKSGAQALASFVGPAIGRAFEFARAVVARVIPGIKQYVQGLVQVVRGVVNIVSGIIHGDFGQVWRGIKGIITGALKGAFGAVRAMTGPAREALSRIGRAAVGVLHDLGARFVGLGKNLIEGLINGVKSKAKAVANAAKDVAKGAVDGVKNFLGIKSPSTVFHGIGQDTMAGYIGGLLSKKEAVAAGLNGSLLFPIDAAITALNTKKEALQKTWDAIDARAQRSALVAAVKHPSGGSSGGSGGGSSSGGSASLKGLPKSGGNSVARTALAVAKRMGASSKQTLALVEAGIVESGMRNLNFGDRDSVGFLQQRPSQGWKGLRNVPKAAAEFLSHAKGKKSGGMTAGQLAQSVQGSAFPGRYDAVKGKAQAIIRSMGGSGGGVSSASAAKASKEIAANEQKIYNLRKKSRDLPPGKASTAERKQITNEIAAITQRNKALKTKVKGSSALADAKKALQDFDTQAKRAAKSAKIELQVKNLDRLNAFKDAIKGVRDQVHSLAGEAASAWRTIQEGGINKAYDAALAAIDNSPAAQELAGLLGTDAKKDDEKTTRQLNGDLADAIKQYRTDKPLEAAGLSDEDVIKKATEQGYVLITDAVDAIDGYKRHKREDELGAQIQSAKDGAGSTRDIALGALDQQTIDYEAGLNAQFDILTTQLENRKIAYSTWAGEVNGILKGYGLTVATDPGTEGAIGAGPGAAAPVAPPQFYVVGGQHGAGAYPGQAYNIGAVSGIGNRSGGHRASGGWVYPGMTYDVGEVGPERFTPAVRGHITPASRSGSGSGGGGDVHFHGDVNIRNGMDVDRLGRKMSRALNR